MFPAVILLGGVYFSFRFRFFSLAHPVLFFRELRDGNGSFRSLNLALAGTLGVGNIVGVVNALRLGGEGAVLWMCISAFFCANLKYAEAYMASRTRIRRGGESFGGAYVYIEAVFGKAGRVLAVIFSVCFVASSLSTGSAMQAGAVVGAISTVFPSCSPFVISSFLTLAVLLSVVGGLGKISHITDRVIPFMTAIYLLITLAVTAVNLYRVPSVIHSIVRSAFSRDGVIFGIGGFCFTECMRSGIMRGLLSNEAGCGSSASAHATGEGRSPHGQGCLGVAEVYVDTVIMCTLTALALLTAGADFSVEGDIRLALLTFGNAGGYPLSLLCALCIAVFGYATLICFAGYGFECIRYIFKKEGVRNIIRSLFLLAYLICVLFSPDIEGEAVLLCADLSMGIMSLINIPALAVLFSSEESLRADSAATLASGT